VSQDNVEIVRSMYAAFAEQGLDAALEFMDPEFETTTPGSLASEPDTYRGFDGIRRYFGSFGDAMQDLYFESDGFTVVGDQVLVETTMHARGRTTGIEAAQRAFLLWTVRAGKVSRMETFAEREQALRAAEQPHG
jgi:ketosteroid isomerase-like protein